jgi:hypothetical protein
MNKITTVLCLCLTAYFAAPSRSFAYDIEQNGLYYNITDGESLTLELTTGNAPYDFSNVSVPMSVTDDGKIYIVTSIGNDVFAHCQALTSVNLPQSILYIGDGAFFGCEKLSDITFLDHLMTIGRWAFASCKSLESVTIPQYTQTIGAQAFANCINLKSAEVKSKTDLLPEGMFLNCKNLSKVILPDIATIGKGTFEKCTSLADIKLPATLTAISASAFCSCTSLTSVSLPSSLNSIGREAFWGCTALKTVSVPSSVSSIGFAAFADCTALTRADLPKGLGSVGEWCFNRCSKLEEAPLPNMSALPAAMFNKCVSLKTIAIPDGVRRLGYAVFADCTSASAISYGNSLKAIGDEAFYNCDAVTKTEIPESVDSIGRDAYENCSGLKVLSIPSKVNTIALNAFRDCLALTDVYSFMRRPCSLPNLGFADATFGSAVLHVPTGTTAAYRATKSWNKFKTIKEFDVSSQRDAVLQELQISSSDRTVHIKNAPLGKEICIYNISGQSVENLISTGDSMVVRLNNGGAYIVKVCDVTAKVLL